MRVRSIWRVDLPFRFSDRCVARFRNLSFVRHGLDRGDESVTMARDGHDVLGLVWGITERLTERGNVLSQAIFADEAVGPHQLHELIFFNDTAARRHQYAEEIERFGRERHGLVTSPQLPRAAFQSERPELVALTCHRAKKASDRRFQNFHGNFSPL